MKNLIGALAAVILLAPSAVLAAEAGGPGTAPAVVESWDVGKRVLTIRLGWTAPWTFLGCTMDAKVNVPPSLAKGKSVYIQYTGAGAGLPDGPAQMNNKCDQLGLN